MSYTLGSNSGPQQAFMRAKHFETVLTAFSSYFTSQLPHRSAE